MEGLGSLKGALQEESSSEGFGTLWAYPFRLLGVGAFGFRAVKHMGVA